MKLLIIQILKNNEKFEESFHIILRSLIDEDSHPLYTEATDGGVSYERIGEWDKAEKDLLASLKADPNQAYALTIWLFMD